MKTFFVYLVLMAFLPNASSVLEDNANGPINGAEFDGQVFNIVSSDANAGNKMLTVTKEDGLGKADPLDGNIFLIESAAPNAHGRLLDSDGYSLGKNGTKVQLWQNDKAHNYMHQRWKFVASDKGNNLYYIISMSDAAGKFKYLDASWADLGKNGDLVQLWEYNGGTDNQLWKVTQNPNGTYRIACAHPNAKGGSLDADGYTQNRNGGKVQLWQPLNNQNQEWNLIAQ